MNAFLLPTAAGKLTRAKLHTCLSLVVMGALAGNPIAWAQRPAQKPQRAAPPVFRQGEFSGVFFDDPLSQLQGDRPVPGANSDGMSQASKQPSVPQVANSESTDFEGDVDWKSLISDTSIEDLVKGAKSRLDDTITTPAKFAGGGFMEARREFTLLATMMAIIKDYPAQVRWKASADYGQRIFARTAANCKVGTQPVYNEAKIRQGDLQELLKGAPLSGNADEVDWETTADRGPLMQLLKWALRDNLAPMTSNEKEFQNAQDEILKFAELTAAYGRILHLEGMVDGDDEPYAEMSKQMTLAALELAEAAKSGDADGARIAVGKIDASCNRCHESYR